MTNCTSRPLMHLHGAGQMYQGAWKALELLRREQTDWPSWVFLPLAKWTEIILEDSEPHMTPKIVVEDATRLAAIGAWRYSQSIYRIDSVLFESLVETPLTQLSSDLLQRLPEWSVYIETPGMEWLGSEQFGFWAFLDQDLKTGKIFLNLVIDSEMDLAPVSLALGVGTIEDSIQSVSDGMERAGVNVSANAKTSLSIVLPPLINLVLYVCSDGVEYSGDSAPGFPSPKRTKKGWRLFPAQKPRVWELGRLTGDKIRTALEIDGDRNGPSPHIRRAHWHTFLKGPRDQAQEFVKFLPPIPVATETD